MDMKYQTDKQALELYRQGVRFFQIAKQLDLTRSMAKTKVQRALLKEEQLKLNLKFPYSLAEIRLQQRNFMEQS